MPDCPFHPSHPPCELEMDLMILREAERESLEIFYPIFACKSGIYSVGLTQKNIPEP